MPQLSPGAHALGAGRRGRTVAGLLALALAVASLAAAYLGLPSAGAANGESVLRPGETLSPDQRLVSANGRYSLVMQGDGNLVLLQGADRVLFDSGTFGNPGSRLVNQADDGNLVVRAPGDRPLFDTATGGNPGTVLQVQNDGNLVAVAPDGRVVFSTGTVVNRGVSANGQAVLRPSDVLRAGQSLVSPNGRYSLVMQGDGNLVLLQGADRVLFETGTSGNPGSQLQNQSDDGNIVLLAPGDRPLFDTETFGNPGTVLQVQNDGNLVAVAPDGRVVFSTDTVVNPGGGAPNPPPAPPPPDQGPQTELDVNISNFTFDPAQLRVANGAQVRVDLANQDSVGHNITIADANVNQDVGAGATATATFTAPGPGDHPFFCRIHPARMTGTLTVQ